MKAHAQAKARGIYDPSSYLISNPCEYWAEATQAWFEATIRTGEWGPAGMCWVERPTPGWGMGELHGRAVPGLGQV